MSKIYTPNIFITTSYSTIQEFMDSNDLRSLKRSKDILVISADNNRYLQSFKYSSGYENKSTPSLILEFIDADGNFEDSFLNNGVLQQALDSIMQNAFRNKSFIGNYKDSINSILASKFRIYFSFGIGNNIKSWGGPYTADLIKAEFDISNTGLRIYRYTFLPSNSFLFRPKLELDPTHPNDFSDLTFKFTDTKTFSTTFPKSEEIIQYHKNIKTLLKKYVSKIGNTPEKNIIVVLPKINRDITMYILDELAIKSKTLEKKGPVLSPGEGPPGSDEKIPKDIAIYPFIVKAYKSFGIDAFMVDPTSADMELLGDDYRSFTLSSTSINPNSVDITNDGQRGAGKYVSNTNSPSAVTTPNTSTSGSANDNDKPHFILKLEASTEDNTKDEKAINIPPWWKKLQEISVGYSQMTGSNRNNITAWQDNDLRYLKLFKKYGLIENDADSCILVGNLQMILETIYRNQGTTIDQALKSQEYGPLTEEESKKINFEFEDDDSELQQILNSKSYITDLFEINFKHKGNSSFDEKIDIGEFALTEQEAKKLNLPLQGAIDLLAETDIPAFINNMKNSNVLSISVQTEDTYANAVALSVTNDLSQYIYEEVLNQSPAIFKNSFTEQEQQDIKDLYEKYKKYNIPVSKEDRERFVSGVIPNGVNYNKSGLFDEVGVDLFSEEFQAIDRDYNQAVEYAKSSKTDSPEAKKFFESSPFDDPEVPWYKALPGAEFPQEYRIRMFGEQREKLKQNVVKKYNDILNQPNSEKLTYLHLLLTKKFGLLKGQGKLKSVNDDAFFSLSDLIIKMLNLNQSTAGVVAQVSRSSPTKKSMQGQIFDYLYKYNTTLNIKTIPFFHLSNHTTLRKPAFVVSRKIKVVGSGSNEGKSTPFDFFSGLYYIVGYKHVISTREMYSEFTMIKGNPSPEDAKTAEDYSNKPKK